jgi:hypothetical protein
MIRKYSIASVFSPQGASRLEPRGQPALWRHGEAAWSLESPEPVSFKALVALQGNFQNAPENGTPEEGGRQGVDGGEFLFDCFARLLRRCQLLAQDRHYALLFSERSNELARRTPKATGNPCPPSHPWLPRETSGSRPSFGWSANTSLVFAVALFSGLGYIMWPFRPATWPAVSYP